MTKKVKREFNSDDGNFSPQNLVDVIEHMKSKLEYLVINEDAEHEHGDPGRYCYSYISRAPGSGQLRIGQSIKVRDDLYSMLFVSTLHAEYILHCEREYDEEQSATKKLLKDYRNDRREQNGVEDPELQRIENENQ